MPTQRLLRALGILLGAAVIIAAGAGARLNHAAARQQGSVAADQVPQGATIGDYAGEDVMIPMRDGTRLHAQVWRPRIAKGALPILLTRSPYGFPQEQLAWAFAGPYRELVADGYILVFQDIRGRFGSEGKFTMLNAPERGSSGPDESTDAFDTIDWLVRNVRGNNGRVGAFGGSYAGWTAAMATVNPHPALRAISAQASPEDMFVGDDFLHNGALRLDYAWSFSTQLEADGRTSRKFEFGEGDRYSWYLQQRDLAELDRQHLGVELPTWQSFVEHPDYDDYWRSRRTSHLMPATVAVPNLIVAGWWDQEDFYGPLEMYANQERGDAKRINHIVIGPWNHGGWLVGDGETFGPFDLGSPTALWFRREVELKWWRHWLKGEGKLDLPEALVFQSGTNRWQRHDRWPPVNAVESRALYLRAGGGLSFDPPSRAEPSHRTFVSDPGSPVPYRQRPIGRQAADTQGIWLADDQAPFAKRPDVLYWQSEPLVSDLAISGDIAARLFASTTGTDADWVVKLVDVHPCTPEEPAQLRCRQRLVASEVLRGRFRTGLERARPITPNAELEYKIDMHQASHVFRKGHRLGIQVQSSWFPLIDRNPQTFVPNVLRAKPGDFRARTHRVFHSPPSPSSILLPVVRN